MVAQTSPWKQHHYVGEYANDAGADAAVTALGWGTTAGLLYYDTALTVLKLNTGAAWVIIGGPASDTFTSTIVVGNSVAGDVAGVNCHVVNDIGAGEALLPAGGGILHIKRGTYTPAAAISIGGNNITIQGEDGATIINKPPGLNLFEVPTRSEIQFRNLQLDGNGDATGGHLLSVVSSTDLVIDDCFFNNNPGDGTDPNASYGVSFAGSVAGGSTSRVLVANCNFDTADRGVNAESTDQAAQAVASIFDVRVVNCVFTDCSREGVRMSFGHRLEVSGVVVIDAGTVAVTPSVTILGNATQSVDSEHVKVDQLHIEGGTGQGMNLSRVVKSVFSDIVVVDTPDNGFNINNVDNSTFTNCIVEGSTAGFGVAMATTSTENSFSNCQFINNFIDGMNILDCVGTTITGCHINGNAGDGIDLDNADNSVITGNRVDTNTGNGIDLDAASDKNIISNNVILNQIGTNLVDAGTNTVKANNIIA